MWNQKTEPATFLSTRSVCEAFGPGVSEQAGSPKEFVDYEEQKSEKNYLNALPPKLIILENRKIPVSNKMCYLPT